ncbi:MAG: DMT family transporter [Fimbriimonadaceae bacterium]|nr:DMT family transporter [Fimbriimonadaceae bacterium]
MTTRPKWLPHPAIVFVVLAWGFNFIIIKYSLSEWPVQVLMVLRYIAMIPFMWGFAKLAKQTFQVPRELRWRFWWVGFLSTGLYMVLFLEGMQRVGAAQGAICLATAPLWVSLFATLNGEERARWQLYVGGLISYLGVAAVILFGTGAKHWTPEGVMLVLGSAIVWAVSVVLMKPILKDRPAMGVYLGTYAGAALILLPYGGMAVLNFDYSQISWVGWSGLAYLTIVAGAGAFCAYYIAVREVGSSSASRIGFFVPIVAAFTAWAFRGESLNVWQSIGIAVVLLGVWLAQSRKVQPEGLAEQLPDGIG